MSKIRIFHLASELGIKSKDLIQKLKEQGIEAKNHMASLEPEIVELVKEVLFPKAKEEIIPKQTAAEPIKPEAERISEKKQVEEIKKEETVKKKKISIGEVITVKQFAEKLGCSTGDLIKKLMEDNIMATINQVLSLDVTTMVADKFGFEIEVISFEKEVKEFTQTRADSGELIARAPVVTIMGHVDHGKTSLLDAIRKANVAGKEAGGITQHIGAYDVELPKGKVVFLDTPGHEAFTAMRARGAKVTDIVVLVVAADDGVMPQTIEAIDHARAANVPIVVAVNKIDKPGANLEKIKQVLSDYNLLSEDWGGKTIFVPVSAKMGKGIEDLLEMILLQAEVLELKANPLASAMGVVIEAKLDKGRGVVATVLVQNGTLKVGDIYVVGPYFGRVRALINSRGKKMTTVGPSTPIEVLGLSGLPSAGDTFVVVTDEKKARQFSNLRLEKQREERLFTGPKITLEDLHKQISEGKIKELNIVLKVDVQGSLQPLREALEKIRAPEINVRVIHASVGGFTDTDVMLAVASSAILIGFNIRPTETISKLAKNEKVDLRLYTIIYNVVSDIKSALEGLLEPDYVEKVLGHVNVRKIFTIPKFGVIAGCYVTDGSIPRNAQIRLIRDNTQIYQGKISSLKHFKDDVKEVSLGFECGIAIEKYNDIHEGDTMEGFIMEKVPRKME